MQAAIEKERERSGITQIKLEEEGAAFLLAQLSVCKLLISAPGTL